MLQKLAEYNLWANKLLTKVLKEELEKDSLGIPEYSINLLSHIANAQTIWTCRIQGIVPEVGVWQQHHLDLCIEMLLQSSTALMEIVKTDTAVDRIIDYKISTGELFSTAVEDILLHVFNHSTYHRAQIAKDMKMNGLKPVNTDYIQFARRINL